VIVRQKKAGGRLFEVDEFFEVKAIGHCKLVDLGDTMWLLKSEL